MKLTKYILGCALTAGLMTFAADKAEAGVVIGNTLFSPLKLKVTVGVRVYNDKGTIKKLSINSKVSFTSKEVLKMLGYGPKVQLAITTGTAGNNHIYVINKDSVLEDLTADGILTADVNELFYSCDESENGQFKYVSSGILSLYFYSNPQFMEEEVVSLTIANNPSLDQAASENDSPYWFEISGFYSYSETGSAVHNLKKSLNTSLNNVGALSGIGHDVFLDGAPNSTTVKGSATAKGNGKVDVGGS